jgi:hypothetical protein
MDKKIVKIALVIKTDSLDYDDRVRKEILTIQKLYPNIRFKIFVMLLENIESEGTTDYGVPYKSIYSQSRDKYSSAQKKHLKAYEFYRAIKNDLKSFDAIWCANVETSFVALLVKNKNIIWDLHELPSAYLGNFLYKSILKFIFKKCSVVVHANPQRIDYLKSINAIADKSKHIALRNFPNFDDVDEKLDDKYYQFIEWKGEKKCVYLQGLNNEGRAAFESIVAVLKQPKLVAVIVGGFDPNIKEKLIQKFGNEELQSRVFFAGKIAQLKIPQYIKQCFMSLVFYKNIRHNNLYCEANRFYQAVIMGLPVVAGFNPTMKHLIEKYNFGVSIDDDGSNISKISDGIKKVMENYEYFHHNNLRYREELLWEKQEPIIRKITDKLLAGS